MQRSLLVTSLILSTAAGAAAPTRFPTLGGANARVTIIAFVDYQCPFAKRASKTMDQLLAKYGDQLQLIYRNIPIKSHPEARPAAAAVLCAHAQGRFKRMHDDVFANQKELSRAVYLGLAQDDGLDMPSFESCLDSAEIQAAIQFDLDDARAFRVNASPSFFFTNGEEMRKIIDEAPAEVYEKVIDELMAPAKP